MVESADESAEARTAARGPSTVRGEQTKRSVLIAARHAFEELGYADTRVADISKLAGLSHGSFYHYFTSKEEVFALLAEEVVDDLYRTTTSTYRGKDPAERLRSANTRFFHAYRRHGRIMAVLEQAATLNPSFQLMRRNLRSRAVARIEHSLNEYRQNGLIDPNLELHATAHALVGMTFNFAYSWYGLGEPFDEATAIETINRLWTNALALLPVLDDTDDAAEDETLAPRATS